MGRVDGGNPSENNQTHYEEELEKPTKHEAQQQYQNQFQQQPQAYPPPQAQPQAYPPPQAQPQAYPPPQAQPQAYPPHQAQPQAYPPPQAQAQHQAYSPMKPESSVGMGVPVYTPTVPPAQSEAWNTQLFDCMDDPSNAVITACFPCVTFGQIAEIVDKGQTPCATSGMLYGVIAFCIAMPCLISCTYRTKLRDRYGLIESPAPDWITHCFCEWCALCQEYRELQKRGIDPSIGWSGNVARNPSLQQQQIAMMPPMNQRMMG